MVNFSVLMSLYKNEKAEYFIKCIESILNQTVLPSELVIVKDGPLTDELDKVLDSYVKKDKVLYKIVPLKENHGLGYALSQGVLACSNEIIFRMDTDDIADVRRFEIQLKEFKADLDLDICGSYITEFEDIPENIIALRKVPLEDADIKLYQKRRDAFNHMTVAFKKSSVLRAGNYRTCLLMEDTLLWVHMMIAGAKCKNIPLPLVNVRAGKDMYRRRGGWEYFLKYKNGRKKVRETGYISSFDYYYTLAIQFVVALVPGSIRRWIFLNLLR